MKLCIFSAASYEKPLFTNLQPPHFELEWIDEPLSEATAYLAQSADAVVLFVNDLVSSSVIDHLLSIGVRCIAMRCAGYDRVDVSYAKKVGMPVFYVPKYPHYATAEHAVALMMALNRNLIAAHNKVIRHDFSLTGLTGFNFYGKTVGIIGVGAIGEACARIMKGFGCKVMAYDPNPNADLQSEGLLTYHAFEEILRQSDILSLHCPLNPETYHLINTEAISLLKPGTMLINAGRGGLVDTLAVLEAVDSGQIGWFGLDVYENERGIFFYDHTQDLLLEDPVLQSLLNHPRILLTSHQGFLTKEALASIVETTYQSLLSFEAGIPVSNRLA